MVIKLMVVIAIDVVVVVVVSFVVGMVVVGRRQVEALLTAACILVSCGRIRTKLNQQIS